MKSLRTVALSVLASIAVVGLIASRNAGGTYSLPATHNPVVSGTPISSVGFNATMSDLATELTDSLSRSGKGAMLAPLRLTNGAASLPSVAFSSETGTGFWRNGTADMLTSLNTTPRWRCNSAVGCGPVDTASGASYYHVGLVAPALAASYSLTLPAAAPANTRPLFLASTGAISAGSVNATDAVSTATANTVVVRDASARAAFATPSASGDAATKGYVDGLIPTFVYTTADVTDSSGVATYTDITGLSFAVSANKDYWFEADLLVASSLGTVGLGIQVTGPAAPTSVSYWYRYFDNALVYQQLPFATAFSTSIMPSDYPTTKQIAKVSGLIQNGANAGTVQLQFASETGTAVTVYKGSVLRWKQLN